jgi:aspartyl-tRNA(Asn)/glutamyl-tRNA(Gln) amidotransferase subunit A
VTEPHELGAVELRRRFLARELSPLEALESCAQRIESSAGFNAFTALGLPRAREAALAAERAYAAGEGDAGPLLGVPVAVKDLIDTAGLPTTYGSTMFMSNVPSHDAACVARLRAAGAVLVGKLNLFEMAWGITSSNDLHGDCLNPWDPSRSAGGSSGGSAAALALLAVPLTLGTDTGGSIRIPAAFCGVMGFKPSFGRVSTDGVFPLAPSMDHVGPMARRPEDLALAMHALTGREFGAPGELPGGLRAGTWAGPTGLELDDGARAALDAAAAALRRAGADVEPVGAPALDGALETFTTIQLVEALRAHRERGVYPARRHEYAQVIADRLERAQSIEPGRHAAAEAARRELRESLDVLLARCEILVSPVAPIGAPPLGAEREVTSGTGRGLRQVVMGYTVPQSLAGLPACAVRAAIGPDGLPRGVQVTGRPGADTTVLAAAAAIWRDDGELQARWPEVASAA